MSDEKRLVPRERDQAITRGLTRAEVATLRRGELDPDLVVALLDQSAGLAAPTPPSQGDLIPNRTGWRVGQGSLAERVHPRLWWWSWRSAILIGMGPTWANLLGLGRLPLVSFALGLAPFALLHAATNLSARLGLRPLARAPRVSSVADCPSGTTVRLEGLVVSTATIPTLFRGAPAVLFKSVLGAGEQTQGIDFDLDLDGGERVRVVVRRALITDRGARTREPPACGPVKVDWSSDGGRPRLTSDIFSGPSLLSRLRRARPRYEASVGPGDRVEVCGVLHHEADPESQAPFARQMPTRAVMRAGNKLPLLVRRLG